MANSFLSSLSDQERLDFISGVFDLVRSGQLAPLTEMLDSGVPTDLQNERSDSLLIIAAYAQKPDIVAFLLERGADTSIVNTMGQTAISCAVFRNDPGILKQLLDAGANPDLGHRSGLEIAQQFELPGMEQILRAYADQE